MNKNKKLDEMQIQKKNKIGNSCFIIMFYLIFIDIGLHEAGINWLAYPINILLIISVCMGYYLVRIIWQGSYLGVGNTNFKYIIVVIILSVFLLIPGIIATVFSGRSIPFLSNIGGILILITSFILIVLAVIIFSNISRHKSDIGED